MVIFKNILKTKSDQNIHQNALFKKNFSGGGGACPRTPLAIPKSENKNSCPPPAKF